MDNYPGYVVPILVDWGWQIFSIKGHIVNILDFVIHLGPSLLKILNYSPVVARKQPCASVNKYVWP